MFRNRGTVRYCHPAFFHHIAIKMSISSVPPLLLLDLVLNKLDEASLSRVASTMHNATLRRAVEQVMRQRAELRGKVYSEATECPICLGYLADDDDTIITNCCSQQFHTSCFSRSLEPNGTCPCCRSVFVGSRRLDGLPRGWSSWTAFIGWNEWRTTRQREEARYPVLAANCSTPKGTVIGESLFVTHAGALIQHSSDGDNSRVLIETGIISVHKGNDFYAAISTTGGLYTWGEGGKGQLGSNNLVRCEHPTQVRALKEYRILSVSTGFSHCIAVTDRGVAFMWGSIRGLINITSPKNVETSTGDRVRGASAGFSHVLIVTEAGRMYTFGKNTYGQLGHGTGAADHRAIPTIVNTLQHLHIASVASGAHHSLALTKGGSVLTWGGREKNEEHTTPTFVDGELESSQVRYISAGDGASCAVTVLGELYTWAQRNHEQLGYTTGSPQRMHEFTGEFVEKVSIGSSERLAVTSSGSVFCWGNHTHMGDTVGRVPSPRLLTHTRCSHTNRETAETKQIVNVAHTAHTPVAQWERVLLMMETAPAIAIDRLVEILSNNTSKADGYCELATKAMMDLALTSTNHKAILQAGAITPLVALLSGNGSDGLKSAAAAALKSLANHSEDTSSAIITAGAISPLVELLTIGKYSDRVNEIAAGTLHGLASSTTKRKKIGRSGAIQHLVALLQADRTDRVNTAATFAILNLAHNHTANKATIVAAGAIHPLINLLSNGRTVQIKCAATATLTSLAYNDSNRATIGASGAIPHVVVLLSTGGGEGHGIQMSAVCLLRTLSSIHANREAVVRAGAIGPLVDMLSGDSGDDATEAATWMLNTLACYANSSRDIIASEGAIPLLVYLLRRRHYRMSNKVKAAAAWLLMTLSFNIAHRLDIRYEEATVPLVSLLSLPWPSKDVKHAVLVALRNIALTYPSSLHDIQQNNGIPLLTGLLSANVEEIKLESTNLITMLAGINTDYKQAIRCIAYADLVSLRSHGTESIRAAANRALHAVSDNPWNHQQEDVIRSPASHRN